MTTPADIVFDHRPYLRFTDICRRRRRRRHNNNTRVASTHLTPPKEEKNISRHLTSCGTPANRLRYLHPDCAGNVTKRLLRHFERENRDTGRVWGEVDGRQGIMVMEKVRRRISEMGKVSIIFGLHDD